MSIVEDLLLIFLFLAILTKYFLLQKKFIKQKEYFIDTLSHDLRVSAIAQIRGLDLLDKIYPKNELVQEINESCRFSLEMINMLLNSIKYENPCECLNYENINITDLINNSCEILDKKTKSKNIQFNLLSNKPYFIQGERNGIFKVLTILISTAIINSYKNSSIFIKSEEKNKEFEISIIYQGEPLSEEECKRMFLDNPRFSTVGHGIKLHLAKSIIDFHKGKIFVKNFENNLNSISFSIPINKTDEGLKKHIAKRFQPYITN